MGAPRTMEGSRRIDGPGLRYDTYRSDSGYSGEVARGAGRRARHRRRARRLSSWRLDGSQSEAGGRLGIVARQVRDAGGHERSHPAQRLVLMFHVGDEALAAPRLERGKVVRHVAGEQHVAFSSPHEVARMSRTVPRLRQRHDRTVLGHGPARRPPASMRIRSFPVSTTHAHIGNGRVSSRSRRRARISPTGPPWAGLPSRNVGRS